MPTATIKIFLVHGNPKRLRTVELSGWSGKAVAGPRSELEGVLARGETEQSGVYLLAGNDPESGAKLPEAAREDMEVFLEKVNQLLPVLGVELLVALSEKGAGDAMKPTAPALWASSGSMRSDSLRRRSLRATTSRCFS